jgi:hypothetical protein
MADYFDAWFELTLGRSTDYEAAKEVEIAVNAADIGPDGVKKDLAYYQSSMRQALSDARRALRPDGIGVVVFADKTTAAWESLLNSLVDAGWTVTASWPIDTEMGSRLRARDTAALASSVHLVCRPRPIDAGVGDWSAILRELPTRVDSWMRRLAEEGVVGADAIFACLGPAIELYSRFERVETAAGNAVPLGGAGPEGLDYLTHVWAAVAQAAMQTIFDEAEARGFDAESRLAAVWLWTVGAAVVSNGSGVGEAHEVQTDDEEDGWTAPSSMSGYPLPYDTARKLAQPLGADLAELSRRPGAAFAVAGGTARLVAVSERRRALLGEGGQQSQTLRLHQPQGELFTATDVGADFATVVPATTTLDRLHQAMLLFADDRGDGVRRLLVDAGVGADPLFWRLADALSKLYPPASPEKRWVDGLLSRKRMLNL